MWRTVWVVEACPGLPRLAGIGSGAFVLSFPFIYHTGHTGGGSPGRSLFEKDPVDVIPVLAGAATHGAPTLYRRPGPPAECAAATGRMLTHREGSVHGPFPLAPALPSGRACEPAAKEGAAVTTRPAAAGARLRAETRRAASPGQPRRFEWRRAPPLCGPHELRAVPDPRLAASQSRVS